MGGETDLTRNHLHINTIKSTPTEKQDGVVAPLPHAKLAKYTVNIRSFHPNKQFEPAGFRFHGDNRGFSLGESWFKKAPAGAVTSRIWQKYVIDTSLESASDLTGDPNAALTQQSNVSGPGPGLWKYFGDEEKYENDELKPKGSLTLVATQTPHGGQKEVSFKSWYGGENHAFIGSKTAQEYVGKTFVPVLDVNSELFIRVERVRLYMDITSLVYGDGFPNCESYIQDAAGAKLFLGTHVRIGVPATHLALSNERLMYANSIRVEIDREGNFGERLWVFAQILGGPPKLRHKYSVTGYAEVCKVGEAEPKQTMNPFEGTLGSLVWDCGSVDSIAARPQAGSRLPLHMSAFVDLAAVRQQLGKVWVAGPVAQMTRSQWNQYHLKRNPNEGRAPDHYDVAPEKWQ